MSPAPVRRAAWDLGSASKLTFSILKTLLYQRIVDVGQNFQLLQLLVETFELSFTERSSCVAMYLVVVKLAYVLDLRTRTPHSLQFLLPIRHEDLPRLLKALEGQVLERHDSAVLCLCSATASRSHWKKTRAH
jgi:hypothetical protein